MWLVATAAADAREGKGQGDWPGAAAANSPRCDGRQLTTPPASGRPPPRPAVHAAEAATAAARRAPPRSATRRLSATARRAAAARLPPPPHHPQTPFPTNASAPWGRSAHTRPGGRRSPMAAAAGRDRRAVSLSLSPPSPSPCCRTTLRRQRPTRRRRADRPPCPAAVCGRAAVAAPAVGVRPTARPSAPPPQTTVAGGSRPRGGRRAAPRSVARARRRCERS